jgi:hypothetical protein
MAYKFQLGAAIVSGSLTRDAGDLKIRDHAGNEKAKLTIAGDVSGSGFGNFDSLKIDTTDVITDALQLANIASLDGTTESTIEAAIDTLANLTSYGSDGVETRALGSLDVVGGIQINNVNFVDANRQITGSGLLTTLAGITLDVGARIGIAGDTDLMTLTANTVDVAGGLNIDGNLSGAFGSSASLANGQFTVSNVGKVAARGVDVGAGTAISGAFGSTMTLADAKFTVSNAGVVAAAGSVTGAGLASTSTVSGATNLSMGGTVRLDGIAAASVAKGADSFYFLDADDSLVKKQAVGDVVSALAGASIIESGDQFAVQAQNNGGISATATGLLITGSNVAAATAAVASGEILFLDAAGALGRESFAHYAVALAGAGLSASNGVLSTQAGAVTPINDVTDVLAEGYNYLTGTAGASVKLPIDASIGDVVHVKNSTAGTCTIARQSNHTIDGLNSIVLESARGAVSMVYALTSSWLLV